ncbi:MAG TPA: tetratricopeptide repeat protein [Myxococcota bacterium]|jgi:hypothetical protein|nr:tetratricopeptide repeat protein [Myxococcota bacterium]
MRGALAVLLGLLACAAWPRAAAAGRAADEAAAKAHWERGAALYEAGNPEGAIAEWEEGYELSERAEFLLNIAQAYREMGDRDKAAYYYRLYLKRKPDAADAPEVRGILADLDAGRDPGGADGGRDGDTSSKLGRGKSGKGGKRAGRDDGDGDGGGGGGSGGGDGGADGDAGRVDRGDGDGDGDPGADRDARPRRKAMTPEEERLRIEMGSSYDAYERSGLTVEGFRRVRTGSTVMVVGGVLVGAGIGALVLSSVFNPMERTSLEYVGYVGGILAVLGGAYCLYFGYASWAAGGRMVRSPSDARAGLGFGLVPAPGGAALTLSGTF